MTDSKLTKGEAEAVAEQAAEGDIFENPSVVISEGGWYVKATFEIAGFKGEVNINEFEGDDITGG